MKTKNLPKEISFFSNKFKVLYIEDISMVDPNKESILFGRIDFKNNEIRIFNSQNSSIANIWGTLWHEILHALVTSLHLDLPEEEEERWIDLLAMGITHCCLENRLDFSNKDKE